VGGVDKTKKKITNFQNIEKKLCLSQKMHVVSSVFH